MTSTRTRAIGAAGFALVLVLSACGSGDESTEDSTSPGMSETEGDHGDHAPESTGDPFADLRTAAVHMPESAAVLAGGFSAALDLDGDSASPAADLRAGLTALLQEHVYAAGVAVATAYEFGPDSAEFELASEMVDQNSVALSEAIGELAGEDRGEEFLNRWRDHIGYFVDYAVAVSEDDTAGADAAVDELRQYTQEAGTFFEEISEGELPADAVTESLNGHVDTLAAAVDSLAAGDADAFSNLQAAAHHVVEGAEVLSGGLAAATDLEGDPADASSELRTTLTANLNEHVYLAGIAVFVAYTDGPDSPAFEAATDVVDANAVELADAIGGLTDDQTRETFLALWRDHIGYFVDYAVAVSGGDDEAAQAALDDLEGYRTSAGDFFEDVSGGELPADDVAESLGHHISTLAGAIDSLNEAVVQSD